MTNQSRRDPIDRLYIRASEKLFDKSEKTVDNVVFDYVFWPLFGRLNRNVVVPVMAQVRDDLEELER